MDRVIKLFSLLTLSLALSSCGYDAHIRKQPAGEVEIPEYFKRDGGPFLIDDQSFEYQGTILIWGNEASDKQIQTISELSDARKIFESDHISFIKNEYGPENLTLKILEREEKSLQNASDNDVRIRQSAFIKKQLETLTLNSKLWFQSQLDSLEIEGLNKREAEAKFRLYCEAKLWEMAASKELIAKKFTSRPTPNALCESIYSAPYEGLTLLDKTQSICANSKNGKSYFKCLWLEGVFKTEYWRTKISDDEQKETVDLLISLVHSGKWEDMLMNEEEGNSFNKVMQGRFRIDRKNRLKPNKNEILVLGKTRNGLAKILEYYEQNELPSDSSIWMFNGNYSETTEPQELATIRKAIRLLGYRDTFHISASDILYNQNKLSTDVLEGDESEKNKEIGQKIFPDIFGNSDPSVNKPLDFYVKAITEAAKKVGKQEPIVEKLKAKHLEIDMMGLKGLKTATESLQSEGAVLAVWPSSPLEIRKIQDGYQTKLRTSLKNTAAVMVGCFSAETGNNMECPTSANEDETEITLPSHVKYDPETGKIELQFTIEKEDKGQGFESKEKDSQDPAFNLIPQKDLIGRKVTITLYPTEVNGLPYLTGEVKLESTGLPTFFGGANLSGYVKTKNALFENFEL